MTTRSLPIAVVAAIAFCFGCVALADDMPAMQGQSSSPATQPSMPPFQAVDLHNTICPVSGDKVDNSNLVEVYDGKIYHLCCPDCHKDFEKDPAKYATAVAANPGKYGIK
jgi:YHS domain-containing protein